MEETRHGERNAQLDYELTKLGLALRVPCWDHCGNVLDVKFACEILQGVPKGFQFLMFYASDCLQMVCCCRSLHDLLLSF